ncbi:MAG: hypothetical protein WBF48_13175 [Halarcobacter sp.]
MKKINIKDKKVEINLTEVLNAVSQKKNIEIDIEGEIYFNKNYNLKKVIIFKLDNFDNISSILEIKALVNKIFKSYNPIIKNNSCILSPLKAWQEVISLNQTRMLYFDHQSDGVELFEDKQLEDIGWNAIPCDISYREISEFIESNCEGILVYYDNEIQFNGFVIVEDIEKTRILVKEFIIKIIKEKIVKNLIDIEDDDVIEALAFFEIKV